MITKYKKELASEIAKELIKNGMLFGEELETYIKLGTAGEITFNGDADYLEFEEYTLEIVEKTIKKAFKITDTFENKEYKFLTVDSASKQLGINPMSLYQMRTRNKMVQKRYRIEKYELTIKDLVRLNYA